MQISTSHSEDIVVIAIEGRVDSSSAGDPRQVLHDSLETGAIRLVANLEAVDYISSAGLLEFMAALKRVDQKGGDLRLASPTEHVQEVLQLSGLNSLFSIYDSTSDAVSSF